ncbi:MAG TPA: DNA polymerase III subunit beta [Syntrophomonadaceae bacterium]|nr:DNA polymerase III subunit beta [Syntrophomonadaceae bacterium]
MKVQCTREDLVQALAALGRIVPSRASNPVLNGCLMFTQEGMLVMQSTDLDLSLTIKMPVMVQEEGSTVVPARYFLDLVRRLPEGEVDLNWNELSNQLEINYNDNRASIRLNTWPPADFPSIHPRARGNSLKIDGEMWKNIIKKVIFAAAPRELRPNYAGVYFHFKNGQLSLVATDTYRLSLLTLPDTVEIDPEETGFLVPAAAITETGRLVEDKDQLEITWDLKLVSFQTERFILTSRLIEAQFPAYEKVIPGSAELEVYADKAALEACLERASLFVAPTEHFAVTELKVGDNALCISAQAPQVGSICEEIPVEGLVEGECVASFNTRFLLEPLKAMDQQKIRLCLNGSSGPVVYLENGDASYLHLVLPVRRVNSPE